MTQLSRKFTICGGPLRTAKTFYRANLFERWMTYWWGSFHEYEATFLDDVTLTWRTMFGRNYVIKATQKYPR